MQMSRFLSSTTKKFVKKANVFGEKINGSTVELIQWVWDRLNLGAMITTHIASANAHTMCHHSVEYSGVFYMFDYFGITIYLYVSGICTFVYSYPLSSNQDLMTITLAFNYSTVSVCIQSDHSCF